MHTKQNVNAPWVKPLLQQAGVHITNWLKPGMHVSQACAGVVLGKSSAGEVIVNSRARGKLGTSCHHINQEQYAEGVVTREQSRWVWHLVKNVVCFVGLQPVA